jgi:MinD-like ATPase involved in chromosome partitioning or flagellar assembly
MASFDVYKTNSIKEGLILAYQNRPHVLVIDPVMEEKDIKDLIFKFRKDWRLTRASIFAFSSLQSPALIQRALDLGFDEFITKEAHALPKLIDLSKQAAEKARNTSPSELTEPAPKPTYLDQPSSKTDGKSVIFLSSKGGVGTSSLCANIAQITASSSNQKLAVVDLVLPIGSLEAIVGTHDSVNIIQASAMASESAISDFLQESLVKPPKWDFNFLAGSRKPEESNKLDITRIPLILEAMKQIHDVVFVDLGKSLSRISLPAILSADLVVLTLSLDKTTVEQTKAVWNFLKKQGVTEDQIYFLINRSVSLEGLTKSEVEEILGTTIQLAVPFMGRNFTLANNLNEPISTKFPQDAVTISLRQASDEMFQKIENRTKTPDFF